MTVSIPAGSAAAHAFNYMMPSAIIRLLSIVRTGARYAERVSGHEAALKALAALRPQLFKQKSQSLPFCASGSMEQGAHALFVRRVHGRSGLQQQGNSPGIRAPRSPVQGCKAQLIPLGQHLCKVLGFSRHRCLAQAHILK